MPREHPLITFRREHAPTTTDLPANIEARRRAEEDRQRRSVEGRRELHARAEEARRQKTADRAFWTDQYASITAALRDAEGVRDAALTCADLEAAVEAQVRIAALRDLVEPLRQAARHALGPQFSPHLMARV